MSDRELLEKAAKAAGISFRIIGNGAASTFWDISDPENYRLWRPHRDDCDCARLEAACMLDVEWQTQHVIVGRTMLDKWQESYLLHDGDRQAARRYATVRAAAALAQLSIPSKGVQP